MNKKGQVTELYVPFVIIFIILFGVILGFVIVNKYNDVAQTSFDQQEAKDLVTDSANAFKLFDYASLILMGGIFVGLIISGFYIRTNPVFFFVFLTAFIAVMLISPVLSNAFHFLKHSDVVNDTYVVADDFPILDYVTDNFPLFMMIGGFLFLIALFAKPFIFGGIRE